MAVQIGIGTLPDLFKQILLVNRTQKADAWVVLKMEFFVQFVVIFWVLRHDNGQFAVDVAVQKLPQNRFDIVLRHKATDYQIIAVYRQAILLQVLLEHRVIMTQCRRNDIRTVGDISRFWVIGAVGLLNIFFNVHTVADHKVSLTYHLLLREFPVFTHRGRPFLTLPLVAVWVQLQLSIQLLQPASQVPDHRADAAGQNVKDRLFNVVLFAILQAE